MPNVVLISPADDCSPTLQKDSSRSTFSLPQTPQSTEPFQPGPDARTQCKHTCHTRVHVPPGHTITIRHFVIIFSTVVNRVGTPTGSNRCTDCIQLSFSSLHVDDMQCDVHHSHTLTHTHTYTHRLGGCSWDTLHTPVEAV